MVERIKIFFIWTLKLVLGGASLLCLFFGVRLVWGAYELNVETNDFMAALLLGAFGLGLLGSSIFFFIQSWKLKIKKTS